MGQLSHQYLCEDEIEREPSKARAKALSTRPGKVAKHLYIRSGVRNHFLPMDPFQYYFILVDPMLKTSFIETPFKTPI